MTDDREMFVNSKGHLYYRVAEEGNKTTLVRDRSGVSSVLDFLGTLVMFGAVVVAVIVMAGAIREDKANSMLPSPTRPGVCIER